MPDRLELEHRVKTLSPREAHNLLESQPRAMLIDVRSSMEFLFVGHPRGAVHIPWIDEPDWKVNPDFVRSVRKVLLGGVTPHDDGPAPVVLICRSGRRSLEAGAKLLEEGFETVFNIRDGFEGPIDEHHHRSSVSGWRFEGLPWEQC